MLSEDGLPAPPRTATEFAADLQFDLETRQAHVRAGLWFSVAVWLSVVCLLHVTGGALQW